LSYDKLTISNHIAAVNYNII